MTHTILPAFLAVFASAALEAAPMKQQDRDRLIAHLEMTERWLADEVSHLSPEQLTFRMAPNTWSITDVVDHLTVAEPQYWEWTEESMKQPPVTEKMAASDAAILWYGIDRTERTKTAEAREPKRQIKDAAAGVAAFRKLRATILEYARNTDKDLRSYRFRDSQMDVYQWLLMISTHSQRHILQIREIKAHPNFPRS
jgi:hypothetical protein